MKFNKMTANIQEPSSSVFLKRKFSIPVYIEFKIGDSVYTTIPYEIEVRNSLNPNEEINDIMPNKVELKWSDY